MKKFTLSIFLIIIFAIITLLLPSVASASSNLKYFGYYYGVGSFDRVDEADLEQISQYSNSIVISTISQLQAAYQRGMKGIVVLSGTFWNYADRGADGKVNLHSDWQARWDQKWQELFPHLSKIMALYPIDEPDINVRQEDYNQVVSKVKESLNSASSNIPIMMTLSPYGPKMIRDSLWQVPFEVNWLGFNEYGCWGRECIDGLPIADKLDILVDKMFARGDKVFVIQDGFKSGNSPPTSTQQQVWVARNQSIFDLCATRNICIGMFTFLWPTLTEDNGLIGVQDMPVVEADLRRLGNLVTSGQVDTQGSYLGNLVSQGKSTNASQFYPTNPSSLAVDGITSGEGWNAGDFAPQWIEVDLGAETSISGIRLYVSQSPPGNTIHLIQVADSSKQFNTVHQFDSDTKTGEILQKSFYPSLENIRYVRARTTQSPSWVSWYEVQVFGPQETITGDANGDGKVDGLDYIIWLANYNQSTGNGASDGDFNNSGKVDGIDYVIWLNNYQV